MRLPHPLLPYAFLLWAALPLLFALVLHRFGRGRWTERFGNVPRPAVPVGTWIHAASVGEVQAASPLIEALLARGENIAVTTTTATGSDLVRARWGARLVHAYLPIDVGLFVDRFLDRLQPRRAVVMETELWPNLFTRLHARNIPLLIANARLSERSLRRYRNVPQLVQLTLSCCTHIAAQSAEDASRYTALGATRVEVSGNMKFDCVAPADQIASGRTLRTRLGTRPVWIAASTHAPEEVAALDAHRVVLRTHADAVLILVPRHPQRFDEVAALLAASGLRVARRSTDNVDGQTQVLLGDSLGEMWMYLAASDVAFVGGSLAPIGGHNVLEPAALGLPVLFGPQMHHFRVSRDLLLAAGGALEIHDADTLGREIGSLISNTARREALGKSSRSALAQHAGATARVMAILDAL